MHSILRTHCHGVSAVLHSKHKYQEIEFMTQLLNGIDFAFPLETVYSQRPPHTSPQSQTDYHPALHITSHWEFPTQ